MSQGIVHELNSVSEGEVTLRAVPADTSVDVRRLVHRASLGVGGSLRTSLPPVRVMLMMGDVVALLGAIAVAGLLGMELAGYALIPVSITVLVAGTLAGL